MCVCECVCTTTGYCLNYTLYSCDVKSLILRNSLCLMAHNSCMHVLCVCVCVCVYICITYVCMHVCNMIYIGCDHNHITKG